MSTVSPECVAASHFANSLTDLERLEHLLEIVELARRGTSSGHVSWSHFDRELLLAGVDRSNSAALHALWVALVGRQARLRTGRLRAG
jgi:hypothetical protein